MSVIVVDVLVIALYVAYNAKKYKLHKTWI